MTFHDAYHDLEDRFRARAEADGDIYLPNVEPSGPVEYVFIAIEPSLGRWAGSPHEAKGKVKDGFRNFVADEQHLSRRESLKPALILHYSGLAGQARAAAIRGHETEFEAFRSTVPSRTYSRLRRRSSSLCPPGSRRQRYRR
jgi:hypothetical protein